MSDLVRPAAGPHLPPTVQPIRALVWALHLALPLAGLWLLLAHPGADLLWHHPPSHFWLVLTVSAVNVALGVLMGAAARERRDSRLFLVSLAFLASAGFLLLHALATPGVVVAHPNVGFDISQPVGLALASLFAFASSLPLDGPRAASVARAAQIPLAVALGLLLAAWAAVMLLDLPPLNAPQQVRDVEGPMRAVAVGAVALFALAALRYFQLHRRRPAAMLISIVTAFALLAEAMVAVTLADKWHLSWWEWHLLLAFAFGFVAYSAYVQYAREGSSAGLFDAIGLAKATRDIRAGYAEALEDLTNALQARERGGPDPGPVAARVAERFGLTEGQTAVLDRAGVALAAERHLSARLAALVAIGEQARVGLSEDELMHQAMTQVLPAYGDVRLGLVSNGLLSVNGRRYDPAVLSGGPVECDGLLAYPLTVKGRVAGVLELPDGDRPHDRAMAQALANQISIALENARLYRELGTLFRQYLSPDVADALLADPDQAALGGSVVEVTALFADLRGFTTFSEGVPPAEIVRMLNRYHGVAVPCILDNGGTVVQFVGDALLALFNAPVRQPDHAARAVRAALSIQDAVAAIAAGEPDWPRFRIGVNTGPALVGNIGSDALRGFNAMGDAVNVAARLQSLAEPGRVVVGETTRSAAGDAAQVEALGDLTVKGRLQPVRAYVVTALDRPVA